MTAPEDHSAISMTIKASEFKAKCLKFMDEISANGGEIVITKNGRPVSRLVPYRERPNSLFGIDREKIEIHGDIVEPVGTDWEIEAGKTLDSDR